MLKNNKGFAVTAMVYGMMTIASLIMFLTLDVMSSNKNISREFADDVEDELNKCSYYQGTCYDWHEEQPFIELKGIIKNPQTGATTNDAYNAASYNIYRTKIQFFADENYSSLIYRIRDLFTVFSDLKNAYVQREDQKIAIEAQKIVDDPQFISPYLVQKGDELVIPYKKMFDSNSSGLDF